MTSKEDKAQLKNILKKIFVKEDNISFFFLKKSKVDVGFQNKIPFKTRKSASLRKAKLIKLQLKKETGKTWELIQWDQIIGKLIPQSRVYKTPFFDTKDIEVKNPWRICPIGEHWVIRHPKHFKSGKITDHDGHCRQNPSGKDLLKGDEIDLIRNHGLFKNPDVKVDSNDFGFKDGKIYDDLISGWTAYWNDVFKLKNPLDPNAVKILMATESGFNPLSINSNNSKKIGPARGLLQITEATQRWLSGAENEIKDHRVILNDDEIWDANKNICAGVRWLFRKRQLTVSKLKREPTLEELLMDYKGQLRSKSKEAERTRARIKKLQKKIKSEAE